MKADKIGLALATFLLIQCDKTTETSTALEKPSWVSIQIIQYQNERMQNPPREIWEYDTLGHSLFKITSPCCDGFDSLFNGNGDFVCALGGFTGKGDGKCADAIQSETGIKLVWRDKRNPA